MTDVKIFLLDNLGLILTTIFGSGSFVAYVLERNKRKIEDRQMSADALKTMQDAYDRFTIDSTKRYEELCIEVLDLKKKLTTVTLQVNEEKNKYEILSSAYEKLKHSYNMLKRNFDDYKRTHNQT